MNNENAKVIDMFSKQEIVEMPFTKEQGIEMIKELIGTETKLSNGDFMYTNPLIDILIRTVENNTGASRFDVMSSMYDKHKAAGDTL